MDKVRTLGRVPSRDDLSRFPETEALRSTVTKLLKPQNPIGPQNPIEDSAADRPSHSIRLASPCLHPACGKGNGPAALLDHQRGRLVGV